MVGKIIKTVIIMILVANTSCYQPKIIAHRGFWKTAQNAQNSIQGIKEANKHQFYGSEFDVRLTKDSALVVYHDHELNGIAVEEISLKALKKEKLSNGEDIPTLDEFLSASKNLKNIQFIAELKPLSKPELEMYLVTEAIKIIKQYDLLNQTDYISFSANICDLIKTNLPASHVQYLKGDLTPQEIKSRGWDGLDYNYKILLKNKEWIKEAHNLGLTTNSWTVNSKEIFKALKKLKIQMITTDEPLKLKNL